MNFTFGQGHSGPYRQDGSRISIPVRINIPRKVPVTPWALVIALWLMMAWLATDAITVGMDLYLAPEDQRPLWRQIAVGLVTGAVVINAMAYGLFALTDLRALRRMREDLIAAVLAATEAGREEDVEVTGQGKRARRSASTKAGAKRTRRFLSRQSVGRRRLSF